MTSILTAAAKNEHSELASLWGAAIERGNLLQLLSQFAPICSTGPTAQVSLNALALSVSSLLVAVLVRDDSNAVHAVEALGATSDCLSWEIGTGDNNPAMLYSELLLRTFARGGDLRSTITDIVEWRLGSVPDIASRLRLQWAVAHVWDGDETDGIGGAIVDALRVEILMAVRTRADENRPPTLDDMHRIYIALDCLEYLARRCPKRVLDALTECAKTGGLPSPVRMHARRVYARVFAASYREDKVRLPESCASAFSHHVWTEGGSPRHSLVLWQKRKSAPNLLS